MITQYPNLPLLEYKFLTFLKEHDRLVIKDNFTRYNFECLGVFLQCWPNTAGLFEDGGFSGQSLSEYYTTVFIEHESHNVAVFQKNELVYVLGDMNENFSEDLFNHSIKPYKIALNKYVDTPQQKEEEEENELCNE